MEWLQQVAEEDGVEPRALRIRPLLEDHLAFVWEAFNALSGDRQAGPGIVAQIPFVAIDRYATRYGLDDRDEFDVFHSHLKAMDRVWRTHMVEQLRAANGKPR